VIAGHCNSLGRRTNFEKRPWARNERILLNDPFANFHAETWGVGYNQVAALDSERFAEGFRCCRFQQDWIESEQDYSAMQSPAYTAGSFRSSMPR